MKLRIIFNKILGYISYLFKLEKSLGNPIIREIEPTNMCMMDCIMCPRKNMKRKLGYMDFTLFKKIINQAKWNESIWLHHFGDPLMHPKIFEMIEYVKSRGINPRLSTNPNLLTEENCKKIFDSGLDMIVISLDGIDNSTYKYFRGKNANYEEAVKKINRLIKMKNERKSKLIIELSMVKMKLNKDQGNKFESIWNKKGVNRVIVKQFITFDGSDEKILTQGDKETFSKSFKKENDYCSEPWAGFAINLDGIAVACCYDCHNKYIIGDLKKESLKEIWNNTQMRKLRRQVRTKTLYKNELCRTCKDRKEMNLFNKLKEYTQRFYIKLK